MNFTKLDDLATQLAGKVSRFELSQMQERGLRGKGPLAGLSRFDMAQVKQLYEKKREGK